MNLHKTKDITMTNIASDLISTYTALLDGKAKAAASGKAFESIVKSTLKRKAFSLDNSGSRRLETNVPFMDLRKKLASIRGETRKLRPSNTEFVLDADDARSTVEVPTNNGRIRVRVECKFQNVSGTTQEKLVYTVMSLQQTSPEYYTILLVEGEGFDPAMLALTKELCEGNYYKPIIREPSKVIFMNIADFVSWVNRAFL